MCRSQESRDKSLNLIKICRNDQRKWKNKRWTEEIASWCGICLQFTEKKTQFGLVMRVGNWFSEVHQDTIKTLFGKFFWAGKKCSMLQVEMRNFITVGRSKFRVDWSKMDILWKNLATKNYGPWMLETTNLLNESECQLKKTYLK